MKGSQDRFNPPFRSRMTHVLLVVILVLVYRGPAITQEVRLYVESGHSDGVNSVAFSPDEKLLASGSGDGTIRLWLVASGIEIATLRGPNGSKYKKMVEKVCFSPNGRVLAAGGSLGGAIGTVELWNVDTNRLVKTLDGNGHSVSSISFSPNGKTLAVGAYVNSFEGPQYLMNLWDLETGRKLHAFTGLKGRVTSTAFSPDGSILAGVEVDYSTNKSVNFIGSWDVVSGGESKTLFQGQGERVGTITFSADGRELFCLVGKAYHSWDVDTGKLARKLPINGDPYDSNGELSSDGKMLARMVGEKVAVFDTRTALKTKTFQGTADTSISEIAFSPSGKTLATFYPTRETPVKIWDVARGRLMHDLASRVSDINLITFSPDGRSIAVAGGWSGTVKLWNLGLGNGSGVLSIRTFARVQNDLDLDLPSSTLYNGARSSIAFNSVGTILASYNLPKQTIEIWDSIKGKLIESISLGEPDLVGRVSRLVPAYYGSDDDRKLSQVSPDGTLRVELIDNTRILLRDERSGNELCSLISLDESDWVVLDRDGRFDTNKPLDNIEGLHWVMSDEPMTPKPLELFMRQYYEPGLLQRILNCNADKSCEREFKPLPSIAEINRVQPRVEKPLIALGPRK